MSIALHVSAFSPKVQLYTISFSHFASKTLWKVRPAKTQTLCLFSQKYIYDNWREKEIGNRDKARHKIRDRKEGRYRA